MGELLTSELALPAGGIAGAFAVIFATLLKVRVQQRENENAWAREHMDRLSKEREDADKRADGYLEKLDAERILRIDAQTQASKLEGTNEQLQERISQLQEEMLRIRSQSAPVEP